MESGIHVLGAIRDTNAAEPQPKFKSQTNPKLQIPDLTTSGLHEPECRNMAEADVWHLGIWDFEFVWDLVLGIWDLKHACTVRSPDDPR
jgi:hypothetical protein